MVQDLTNPMLAQVPHVLLAAHAGTIAGVETNAMQFYPEASLPRGPGPPRPLPPPKVDGSTWATIRGPGFGYRVEEIRRDLPPAGLHLPPLDGLDRPWSRPARNRERSLGPNGGGPPPIMPDWRRVSMQLVRWSPGPRRSTRP